MRKMKVGAVVVTYKPGREIFLQLVEALRPQVEVLCVVDNGSAQETISWMQGACQKMDVDWILLGENLGLAAAHNAGIAHVRELGLEYVALFDQDSKPVDNMMMLLLDSYRKLISEGVRVGAVGPVFIDRRTHHYTGFVRLGWGGTQRVSCGGQNSVVEADFLISSGSLIALDAINEIGMMNEELFIDHVDTDWCMRARRMGFRLFGVCQARLWHSIGDDFYRVWVGRPRQISVHSPIRNYYEIRNSIALIKSHVYEMNMIMAMIFGMMLVVGVAFLVPPRQERISMIFKGIWHGLHGRMGRLS